MVAAAILLVTLVRVRLAEVPLERDEGEYAYAGQLILHGIPPYQQLYNMKFPGTYYAYALTMAAFGETARGIRLGLLVVNVATVLLVFAIGRRLCGNAGGAVAAVCFALLSLDRWIMGVFAHATHFVLLPALAGLYLLLPAPGSRRPLSLLASGVLLGLAVLMKQHAFPFLLLGALLAVENAARAGGRRVNAICLDLGTLIAGAALTFAVLCAVLRWQGVLEGFWFWTFQYAREYVSESPLAQFLPALLLGFQDVIRATLLLWLVGGVGLIALWVGRWEATARVFITGLLVASFLAICPGFYFRQHYFILLLPAVALLGGVAFVSAGKLLERVMPARFARLAAAALFVAVAVTLVSAQSDFLFAMTPRELSRSRYGENPFIESVEIAKYIRERTTAGDRIAVLGSEPEIYFYAGRPSATGYVYVYPLMEPQKYARQMQDEMIRQIEAARPKYLVFVKVATSWLARPASDRRILDWAAAYLGQRYDLAGVADIFSADETIYVWDDDVRGHKPLSSNLVLVFRRKNDVP